MAVTGGGYGWRGSKSTADKSNKLDYTNTNYQNNYGSTRTKNAFQKTWKPVSTGFGKSGNGSLDKQIAYWFRNNYVSDNYKWLRDKSDAEIYALLEPYFQEDSNILGTVNESINTDLLTNHLNQLSNLSSTTDLDALTRPDYDAIGAQSDAAIDAEVQGLINEIEASKDAREDLYNSQIADLNSIYDTSRRQILSNNYQQNTALTDTVGSELNKARQNALEAGANAGLRIASNINTLMSVQNKQNQLSLDTANNLAQQLLNQRQANMGLTSQYQSDIDNYDSEKRNLNNGLTERKSNARANAYDEAESKYNSKVNTWNEDYDNATSGNYLADSYRSWLLKNNS